MVGHYQDKLTQLTLLLSDLENAGYSKDNVKRAEQQYQDLNFDLEYISKYQNEYIDIQKRLIKILASKLATLPLAIDHQKYAIELYPAEFEFKINLADLLTKIGRLRESLSLLENLLIDDPKNWTIYDKIGANLFFSSDFDQLEEVTKKLYNYGEEVSQVTLKKYYISSMYTAFIKADFKEVTRILQPNILAFQTFFQNDYQGTERILKENNSFFTLDDFKAQSPALIYAFYFYVLSSFYEKNNKFYNSDFSKTLYCIGESHCLSPAHTVINLKGDNYKCKPYPILSARIWELISLYDNIVKASLQIVLKKIPKDALVLFCVGEVDCRINRGIMGFYRKDPSIDLDSHIVNMSSKYVEFINSISKINNFTPMIQGIPASQENISSYPPIEQQKFYYVIKKLNECLKNDCQKYNIRFIDVYSISVNPETGASNRMLHIDNHHLLPIYLKKMLEQV
jgi:hypothetical protein